MKKLKVLTIINHCLNPGILTNLSCLSSLPNLKQIRFEKVSINLFDIPKLGLKSLEKLSLWSFHSVEVLNMVEVDVSETLQHLQDIEIDFCYNLVELPYWISQVVSLKKLSVTNCNKLCRILEAIGNLKNLEMLRLCSCSNLIELPETIQKLSNLLQNSVKNLQNLEVKCEEETAFLWKRFKPKMKNLTITMEEADHKLNFLQLF